MDSGTPQTSAAPATHSVHEPPALPTRSLGWRGVVIVVVAAVAVVGLASVGMGPRIQRAQAVEQAHQEALVPRRVAVAKVMRAPRETAMTLPGSVEAVQTTRVYARSSGFVARVLVDLGDRVKAGQVMAEISAPESDDELAIAEARLQEAELNVGIVTSDAERYTRLVEQGALPQQQADVARARANTAAASAKTTRAEVERIRNLRAYQRVLAPFDGVVTRRLVDKGALISSAGNVPLFDLAQVKELKVMVDVPQSLAPFIAPGLHVEVHSPSSPSRVVKGTVTRTAGALDPGTRTLRTEIRVPGDGTLLAGSFVQAKFVVLREQAPVIAPSSALVVRREGTQVVRVRHDNTVSYVKVILGRDLGKEMEILDGLDEGDTVVTTPPDDLAEQERITPPEPSGARNARPG